MKMNEFSLSLVQLRSNLNLTFAIPVKKSISMMLSFVSFVQLQTVSHACAKKELSQELSWTIKGKNQGEKFAKFVTASFSLSNSPLKIL
jgi:hypothetical protein